MYKCLCNSTVGEQIAPSRLLGAGRALMSKMDLFKTVLNAGSLIVALIALFFAYSTSSRNNDLTETIAEYSAGQSSFLVDLRGDDLLLKSTGAVFSEPKEIYIVPLYQLTDGPPEEGSRIPLVVSERLREGNTLRFSNIRRILCGYPENSEFCDGKAPLVQLVVSFKVNGRSDTDVVSIAGT